MESQIYKKIAWYTKRRRVFILQDIVQNLQEFYDAVVVGETKSADVQSRNFLNLVCRLPEDPYLKAFFAGQGIVYAHRLPEAQELFWNAPEESLPQLQRAHALKAMNAALDTSFQFQAEYPDVKSESVSATHRALMEKSRHYMPVEIRYVMNGARKLLHLLPR